MTQDVEGRRVFNAKVGYPNLSLPLDGEGEGKGKFRINYKS